MIKVNFLMMRINGLLELLKSLADSKINRKINLAPPEKWQYPHLFREAWTSVSPFVFTNITIRMNETRI